MIAKITIERFFSFGESQTIELNPGANILVGINASGKSNFIRAIRFLQDGISGKVGLEELINKTWGGIDNVVNYLDEKTKIFRLTYEFDKDIINAFVNPMVKEALFPANPIYKISVSKYGQMFSVAEELYSTNENKRQSYYDSMLGTFSLNRFPSEDISGKNSITQKATDNAINLRLTENMLPKSDFPIPALLKALDNIFVYSDFSTTFDSKIRQLSYFYTEKELLPNGENLTHLLSYINANHPKNYDLIIEKLKRVNPNFKDLAFVQPMASRSLLLLKEKNLSRAISIEHISDGTLRFLLLLAIFYNPNRGKVICLDEPELGLHPDMIRMVAEGIKYAANDGTQLFIATHSPLLLNEFELENLLIFEKDDKNQTIAMRKSEEDFPDWEGEFYVGQMWLRGQIGGVRW
jgi:predicted ATPase